MKKEYYDKKISESPKLPDLFKELEDIRYGRAPAKTNSNDTKVSPKQKTPAFNMGNNQFNAIKFNTVYVIDHKFNAIGAIIGILFIIMFFSSVHSNYIFASTEKERVAIGEYEQNENALDMMEIVSRNINEVTQKEIVTEEVEVPFETVYIENKQLPKDEEIVAQEGRNGINKLTKIRTFENDSLVDENVISMVMLNLPINRVIEKGTSEYLRDVQAHIGDTLYTKAETILYTEPEDVQEKMRCLIYQYIDVTLKSEENGWAKIVVDGMEGYVKANLLTSENVTPGIKEISRIQRICIGVNMDMPLNTPSGLTRADFIKVLSNNPNDVNKIFEQNAEFFYELEQKYNINGIFVASIGIHESNWGRSTIANQKKNLFGYGSYDSDPYNSSFTFDTYQEGIELVTKVLVKYYINEPGTPIFDGETAVSTYYNGPTLKGVNTRYASDPEWATKVYSTMRQLYDKLY